MDCALGEKPIDAVAFQKINATKEGNNYQSKNFEINILDEGVLDKVLTVLEDTHMGKTPENSLWVRCK